MYRRQQSCQRARRDGEAKNLLDEWNWNAKLRYVLVAYVTTATVATAAIPKLGYVQRSWWKWNGKCSRCVAANVSRAVKNSPTVATAVTLE